MRSEALDQDGFDQALAEARAADPSATHLELRYGPGLTEKAQAIELPDDVTLCACVVDVMALEWEVTAVVHSSPKPAA
jgi:hypothetical protein